MSVTVLAPRTGDSVNPPVVVSSDYDFTAQCSIASCVGTVCDPGRPVGPGKDLYDSSSLAAAGGTHTVTATANNSGGSDSQPGVIVTGGTPPIQTKPPTGGPGPFPFPFLLVAFLTILAFLFSTVTFFLFGWLRRFTISGTVDVALVPPPKAVVCAVFRVASGVFTLVRVKYTTPDAAGNWSLSVWLWVSGGDRYIVRAMVFDQVAALRGIQTKILPT